LIAVLVGLAGGILFWVVSGVAKREKTKREKKGKEE